MGFVRKYYKAGELFKSHISKDVMFDPKKAMFLRATWRRSLLPAMPAASASMAMQAPIGLHQGQVPVEW